jgi:hypothetical protein
MRLGDDRTPRAARVAPRMKPGTQGLVGIGPTRAERPQYNVPRPASRLGKTLAPPPVPDQSRPPDVPIHFPALMSDSHPSTPAAAAPAPRSFAGGVSLLLVVALALTTPAVGMQSLLSDLGQAPVERAGFRLVSGTIASLARGISRRSATEHPVHPAPAVTARLPRPGAATARQSIKGWAEPARMHVRIALLDLPPPLV